MTARVGGVPSRGEDRDKWAEGPSLQPDQEILPKMFQEGVLRCQETSGPPVQCKDCKLRCLGARQAARTVTWRCEGQARLKGGHYSVSAQCRHAGRLGLSVFHKKL